MEKDKPGNEEAGSEASFAVLEKYGEEHPFSSKGDNAKTQEKEKNPELNELGFTNAEEELFRRHDPNLIKNASYHIDPIIDAYYETTNQSEQLKIVLGYIKRNLQSVVESRKLPIDPEERLDEDSILASIVMPEKAEYDWDEPEKIDGLGVDEYKNPEKLNDFFFNLAKNMNAEDTEALADKFGRINDGFRQIMVQYIPQIIVDIDKIINENVPILDSNNEEYLSFPTIEVIDDDDSDWMDDDMDPKQDSDENEETGSNPFTNFDDYEWEDDGEWESNNNPNDGQEKYDISDENIIKYLKFINSLPHIIELKNNGTRIVGKLHELAREKKLAEFHADKDFMADFVKIMEHDKDKHIYYFHGTQCLEDAYSITKQGLGITRKEITSTAYSEFSIDDVILYERGFGGEIGHDAIVLIDVPLNENGEPKDIIERTPPHYRISFNPSGLQGLNGKANYLIRPEHIVGFVDKRNKKIIFNDAHSNNSK